MDRALLESFRAEGLTLAQMGERVQKDPTTVGYWLKKHGLRATYHDRYAPKGGLTRAALLPLLADGLTAGQVALRLNVSESTVRRWMKRHELSAVDRRRRHRLPPDDPKHAELVGALHFHHRDPGRKEFGVSRRGATRAIDRLRVEARKCVLLCSNCHAEVESGLIAIE